MADRQYHNQLTNDLSLAVQYVITSLSLIMNALLLRIIFNSPRKQEIGTYRYLIASCALSDLVYTVIHFLVYPIPEMYGNAFILGGHGIMNSRLWVCIYSGVYAQASPILAFHFLCRAMIVRRSLSFSRPIFFAAMLVSTVLMHLNGFCVLYFLFRPDEETLINIGPLFSGNTSSPVIHSSETASEYVQALYWANGTFSRPRWNILIGAVDAVLLVTVTYMIILSCAYMINKYLKEHSVSSKLDSLHRQLFRSLICQAVYPLLTTYSPLAITILFPVVGVHFDWIPVLCHPMCVSHPLFDALALILCMSEYRVMFIQSIGLSKIVCTRASTVQAIPITPVKTLRPDPKICDKDR